MTHSYLLLFIGLLIPVALTAQHDHHGHNHTDTTSKMPGDTMAMPDSTHSEHMAHTMDQRMSHAYSRNLSMNRNGSGTGWLPDASPMYGKMFHKNDWMFMLHGNIFVRYNSQDIFESGTRGDSRWDLPNWVMFMGQKPVGKRGLFHFSTMLSADALITGGAGYPLLFQSGETFEGKPLVDRQHPHDLFSELSVSYAHAFSKKMDVFVYLGYPGEPAIGPVAFMHRPSALYNPDAPLSHHWIDATHITFGVATLGLRVGMFKLEGSSFTGREPDEHRFNFDQPRFDSWSGRLSFNPGRNFAMQVSHGFLESPEELHPGEDVSKTTASVVYSLPLGNDNWINAAAVWGMNKVANHAGEHAFLLEGSWRKNRLAVYSRYEFVQKSAEELVLDETVYGHDAIFPVNALTLGTAFDLFDLGSARFSLGGQVSAYHADSKLDALYGERPVSAEVYIRIYPGLMGIDPWIPISASLPSPR